MLVDSHCHLNYLQDCDAKLASARAAGVRGFLCIGAEPQTYADVAAIARRHPDVWVSAGLHPQSVDEHWSIDWVESALPQNKIVGIGETGLDYSRIAEDDTAAQRRQRECFAAHLALARRHALPVIVHTRGAEADTDDLLRSHAGVIGVLHCFTESWPLAQTALDLGWYVSISGIVTFRNADNVRDVARRVPADRLLVETDCPWLAPTPHRGKPNEPKFVVETARFLATLRNEDPEILAQRTTENFERL
ncbi:MAG TPA: TatD family hydrolase, partial [Pseudomonadales bacterium]